MIRSPAGVARRVAGVVLALALLAPVTGWGVPAALAGERWGWFGVRIRDLAEAEAEELSRDLGLTAGLGVVVAEVMKETPAARAGLRAGDQVVAIGERPVVDTRTLQRIVGATPPGTELRVTILRDGTHRTLPVRVGEMPPDAVAERVGLEFGFLMRAVPAGSLPLPDDDVPPVVAVVVEGAAAARGGLQAGDRILAVNGREIGTLEELRRLLRTISVRETLRLRVRREGSARSLVIPAAWPSAWR